MAAMKEAEDQAWRDWQEEALDVCALPLVQRMAALLDRDPAALHAGDALPRGWHAVLFTPAVPQSQVGPDGHPRTAGGFAPTGFPRRLLGGRRVSFERDIPIGAGVRRASTMARFEHKQGRSGALAIASLRHSISVAGETGPAIVEEQDIVYRPAAADVAGGGGAVETPEGRPAPAHTRRFQPDPVMLFRYSAITFNGHRIHYDQPYATAKEGYPGLIVNGGLTALFLLELAKDVAGRDLHSFEVRNRHPLFCGRPAQLCIAQASPPVSGWLLWAEDETGQIALEASAR